MARQYNTPSDIKTWQFMFPQLEKAKYVAQLVLDTPENRRRSLPSIDGYFDMVHFFESYDQQSHIGKEIGYVYFPENLDSTVFLGFGTFPDNSPKLRSWPDTAFRRYVITSLEYLDLHLTNKDIVNLPQWAQNNVQKAFGLSLKRLVSMPKHYLTEKQINALRG